MNVRRLVLGACLIVAALIGLQAQEKHTGSAEQTRFSAEDESLQHTVPVPNDVLALLMKEKLVKDALQNEKVSEDKVPASWFSATEVHLSRRPQADLVVRAEPPLAGANTDYFWVFRNTASGHELVLGAPAHDMEIRAQRSDGYREIQIFAMTAAQVHKVVYHFDGKRYVVFREKLEPLN